MVGVGQRNTSMVIFWSGRVDCWLRVDADVVSWRRLGFKGNRHSCNLIEIGISKMTSQTSDTARIDERTYFCKGEMVVSFRGTLGCCHTNVHPAGCQFLGRISQKTIEIKPENPYHSIDDCFNTNRNGGLNGNEVTGVSRFTQVQKERHIS